MSTSSAAVRTFEATTASRYPEDAGDPNEDRLILVDGQQVGCTYPCYDGMWASWGAAGSAGRYPTREAAADAQVRAYAVDPDGYDRFYADALAEREAEKARRKAAEEAEDERWAAKRRRERLGDDEPGPTTLTIPAYHCLYGDFEQVTAVAEWLAANGADEVSSHHEIRVEQRAARQVIVFEKRKSWKSTTETYVVTLTAPAPDVDTTPRPDLHALFGEHWPSEFPLIATAVTACGICTHNGNREIEGRHYQVVPWPCPTVEAAINAGERAA